MTISKPFLHKILSLLLVLSVLFAGLLPTTSAYASEISTPGSGKSTAVLSSDGLMMSIGVPMSVLIHVDATGEVTTPDYLPIINNSPAPIYVRSLTVEPKNDWTLDPMDTNYRDFNPGRKHYWLSINGLDPSEPIAFATPISGSSSLNLDLSADVAPQRSAINVFDIGIIRLSFGWTMNEDAQDPIDPEIPGDEGDLEKFGFSVEGAINTAPKTYTFNLNVTEPGQYFVAIAYPGTPAPKFPHEALAQEFLNITEVGTSEQTVSFSAVSESMADADIYVWTQDSNWLFVGPVKTEVRASGSGGYVDYDDPDFNLDDYPDGYDMAKNSEWQLGAFANDPYYIGTDDFVIIPESVQGTTLTGLDRTFKKEYYSHPVKGVYVDNPNILTANAMFQDSTATTLDLQYINIPNITNANDMFNNTSASTLDLTGWDVSNLRSASGMFKNSAATNIVLSGLDFKGLNQATSMFENTKATTIKINRTEQVGSNMVNQQSMFKNSAAKTIDLSEFIATPPSETHPNVTNNMFAGAQATTLYARNRDDAAIYNDSLGMPAGLKAVIKGQPELPEGYVLAVDSDFDGDNDGEFKFTYRKGQFDYELGRYLFAQFDKFVLPQTIKGEALTSYSSMMAGFYSGDDAAKLPTHFKSSNSAITDMSYMFQGYPTATLNLDFNTSNVINMSSMFSGAEATTLDLSGFNVDKVENMDAMFWGTEATTIDISTFNLANTQPTVSGMFNNSEATTVYVRSQADIDYITANAGTIPATLNFVVK